MLFVHQLMRKSHSSDGGGRWGTVNLVHYQKTYESFRQSTNQMLNQSNNHSICQSRNQSSTSPSIKLVINQPMGKHGLECWGSYVAGTLWVYCYWKQPFSTTATWNTPRSRVQQCLKYLPSLYGYLFSIESSRNRVQTVPVKLFFFSFSFFKLV